MEVQQEGVECPSLSPDGTRIAFKTRSDSGVGPITWRIAVLDLATSEVTELAETRNVDDQVASARRFDDHLRVGEPRLAGLDGYLGRTRRRFGSTPNAPARGVVDWGDRRLSRRESRTGRGVDSGACNESCRRGLRPERLARLVRRAVETMSLDLAGATVLTEAATGAYVVTPVLAALGGAGVVNAVTRRRGSGPSTRSRSRRGSLPISSASQTASRSTPTG